MIRRLNALWCVLGLVGFSLLPCPADTATAPAPAAAPLEATKARPPSDPVYLTGKEEAWAKFPKAPAPGSDVDQQDLKTTLALQASRTEEQKKEAVADKKYSITLVTDVIDPAFATKYPNVYAALDQADKDGYYVIATIKEQNARLRPYEQHPDVVHSLYPTGGFSYPSGHATGSELEARLLATLFHANGQDALLLKRAQQIADSRVVAGVHYASDVKAGKDLGDQLFAALEANAKFTAALAAAAKADNVPTP